MIYEYKCQDCGHLQEVWQKMSDPAPKECASCNAPGKLERVISATSFALKGTGWYTTDYKRAAPSSSANEAKEGKKEAAGTESATPASGTSSTAATPKVDVKTES